MMCMHVVQNWEIYKDLATITHDLPSTFISFYCDHMLAKMAGQLHVRSGQLVMFFKQTLQFA